MPPGVFVFQTFPCLKLKSFNFKGVCSTHCYLKKPLSSHHLIFFKSMVSKKNCPLPHVCFANFWLFPSWHGTQQTFQVDGCREVLQMGVCAEEWVDGYFFLQGHSIDLMCFFQGMGGFNMGIAT